MVSGLRAWPGRADGPHHPAATVTVLVLPVGPAAGSGVCAWFCPPGWWGVAARPALAPAAGEGPRRAGSMPCCAAEVSGASVFCSFIILLAVPAAALPGYLASPYHQAADMKMGGPSSQPDPDPACALAGCCCSPPPSGKGFCRYLCPHGAWFALLGLLTPLRIRRDPARCCEAWATTAQVQPGLPSRIQVHQLIAVRVRVHQLPELRGRLP